MRVDWRMSARLFIGAARNGVLSKEPGRVADPATCVRLIRGWPSDILFCLETRNPVMGKLVPGRDDGVPLPEPEGAP